MVVFITLRIIKSYYSVVQAPYDQFLAGDQGMATEYNPNKAFHKIGGTLTFLTKFKRQYFL